MLRKIISVMAVLLLCTAHIYAKAAREIPAVLRFTQTLEHEKLSGSRIIYRTYPHTALEKVDLEMRSLIDEMEAEAMPYLPSRGVSDKLETRLDTGAYIFRTGESLMSFLTISRIAHGYAQIYLRAEARVYDMASGDRLRLEDLFGNDEAFRSFLKERTQTALSEHFEERPQEALLCALTETQRLQQADFVLTPGRLILFFPVTELYPDRDPGLMRVEIPYPDLQQYMSAKARAAVDAEGYNLAALTYDDGPALGRTDQLINTLRLHGANATFFTVGVNVVKVPQIVHREYDAGFSVQSHNWVHEYREVTADKLEKWQEKMDGTLRDLIGVAPTLMRSPGGNELIFLNAGARLPLIHWSLISRDASDDEKERKNVSAIGIRVGNAKDGDIVLLHDLNKKAADAADYYLQRLEKHDFLLVSLEDLFILRGVKPRQGDIIYSCPPQD